MKACTVKSATAGSITGRYQDLERIPSDTTPESRSLAFLNCVRFAQRQAFA